LDPGTLIEEFLKFQKEKTIGMYKLDKQQIINNYLKYQ
jgi:hypothetical protein